MHMQVMGHAGNEKVYKENFQKNYFQISENRRMNFLALGFFILCLLLSPQLSAAASINAILQLVVFLLLAHVPALVEFFYLSLFIELLSSDITNTNLSPLFSEVCTLSIDVKKQGKNLLIELR